MLHVVLFLIYISGFITGYTIRELCGMHEKNIVLTRYNLSILETRSLIAHETQDQLLPKRELELAADLDV
jgi:hypothetical protein